MQDFQYTLVDEDEWNKLPAPSYKEPQVKIDEVLKILNSGKIVMLQASNTIDLLAVEMAITQQSHAWRFRPEFRTNGMQLYARRSGWDLEEDKNP